MVNFQELKQIAPQLNQESDGLQATLQKIQDNIKAVNVGLHVWLEDEISSREIPSVHPDGCRCTQDVYLGYSKTHAGWGIAIQERVNYLKYDSYGDSEWEIYSTSEPQLLLKASREIRIAALEHLQALVDSITQKAKASIVKIKKAKQLANEL